MTFGDLAFLSVDDELLALHDLFGSVVGQLGEGGVASIPAKLFRHLTRAK